MTDTTEQDERRLARQDGWSSEHFRFREDQMGNLHVARAEWIGPEALSFNLALLPELLDQLDAVKEDVPTEEPAGEDTQPLEPTPAPVSAVPATPEVENGPGNPPAEATPVADNPQA